MFTRRSLLAGAFAVAAILVPLQAQAASWVTLGSRTVSLFRDHDTIRVGLTSAVNLRRRFRAHMGTTPGAYRRTFRTSCGRAGPRAREASLEPR